MIVIPCLNEEKHLPGLLAALTSENPGVPIIVADGGSSDASRRIVRQCRTRHPQVVLLDNPAKIQSAGVNLAIRRHGAGKRWLARIDAHCDYPPDFVGQLVKAAAAHGATSVVVPMVSRGRSCFQRAAAAAQNSVLGTGGSPHRHVAAGRYVDHGHHALMEVELFRQVGGYDERLSHNEDAELDARLRQAGGRLWLEPSLALTYYPRSTATALFRQYWNYGKGRATTRTLHGEPLKLRQLLPLAVPAASVLALGAVRHPAFALPLAIWALASIGAGATRTDPEGTACGRLAGIAAMVMHFAWGWGFLLQTLFGKRLPGKVGRTGPFGGDAAPAAGEEAG